MHQQALLTKRSSALALPTHTTIQKPLTGRPAGYYNDKHYLNGVTVIGVDEHRWSHNRHTWRDGNVIRPAWLFDVVPGRNTDVLWTWLNNQSEVS
ncbi:hypothetical protein I4J42_13390 [Corynebacterium belfantii]|nr:hypothetical protein [Corynebacterium belfantii]